MQRRWQRYIFLFAVSLLLLSNDVYAIEYCLAGMFYTATAGTDVVRGRLGEGRTAFYIGLSYVNERVLNGTGVTLGGSDRNTNSRAAALNDTLTYCGAFDGCSGNVPVGRRSDSHGIETQNVVTIGDDDVADGSIVQQSMQSTPSDSNEYSESSSETMNKGRRRTTTTTAPAAATTMSKTKSKIKSKKDRNVALPLCLSHSHPVGIVGPAFSSHAMVSAVVAGSYSIPLVSPSASSTKLTDSGVNAFFSRTHPADDSTGKAMAVLALELGWTQICAIGTSDDYGDRGILELKTAAEALGMDVHYTRLLDEAITGDRSDVDGRKKDLEKFTQDLADLAPSAGKRCFVTAVFTNGELDLVVAALESLGAIGGDRMYLLADATLNQVESDFMNKKGLLKEGAPPLAELAVGFLGVRPSSGNAEEFAMRRELNQRWAEMTTEDPSIDNKLYDDGDKIPTTSATVYAFDAVLAYGHAIASMIKGGGSAGGTSADPTDGSALQSALRSASFAGASGPVSFDESNGNRRGILFEFLNVKRRNPSASGGDDAGNENVVSAVKIGSFVDSDDPADRDLSLDLSSVVWPNGEFGEAGKPRDRETIEIKVPKVVIIVLDAISGVLIAAAVVLAALIVRRRETRIVRSASPVFLFLIVVGCVLAFANVFVYGIATDAACNARIWIICLSFTSVFGPLLAKTYRTHRIFNNPKQGVAGLTGRGLLLKVAVLAAIDIALLGTMTLRKSSRYMMVRHTELVSPGLERVVEQCADEGGSAGFLGALLSIKSVILIWGVFLSFRTRKVYMKDFNEAKPVAFSIYAMFLTSLIAAPVLLSINGQKSTITGQHVLLSVGQQLCYATVLALIVGTKFFHIYVKKMETRGESAIHSSAITRRGGSTPHTKDTTQPPPKESEMQVTRL